MAIIRLAHFSDIHFTLPPTHIPAAKLLGKRGMGSLNYYFGGRGGRFHNVETRIQKLLEDVDASQVEHALCTGDLTAVAYSAEFDGCAALFGDRLQHPEQYTVMPGNHDRYTRDALEEQLFENAFGLLGGTYPRLKHVAGNMTLVLLDVSRPTSLVDSSGLCGAAQLAATRELLSDPSLAGRFVVVAMHYGLLRKSGARDSTSHRIQDDLELLALLDDPAFHVDLILHGHMHRAYEIRTQRRRIICSGSATDLGTSCGYNIYAVDQEHGTVTVERRTWNRHAHAYQAGSWNDP